ncbi:unnamed protein product, partial [marine sediment metagenome]
MAASPSNPGGQNIAYAYFRHAENLFHSGWFKESEKLLDISLEFFPDFSEGLFLYSRIYSIQQETTLQELNYLEKAIQADSWAKTKVDLAKIELAGVLIRIGRFHRANRVLNELAEQRNGTPEVSLLWAKSLIGLKKIREAEEFLAAALKRFTKELRLYLLYAEVLSSLGEKDKALTILDRGLKVNPLASELLYAKAKIEQNLKIRLEFL